MPVVLQFLGGLVCVAGLLMTGFGLPLRYQNLDNTLIAGGIGAIVGGLVLIGIGAGLRELRRLTRAIERGGIPARADAPGKQSTLAARHRADAGADASAAFAPGITRR